MIFASENKHYRSHDVADTRANKGFTIVELLIVIVVIAILAAITIVAYNGITNRAKSSAAQQSVSQASKKILAYAVDNADAFPAAAGPSGIDQLISLGIITPGTVTYQYSANNTSSPRTFCITATNSDRSFYVSQAASSPTAGACPGHGSGGVAAITNIFTNPGAMSTGNLNSFAGSGAIRDGPYVVNSDWSSSGKAYRAIWSTAPTNTNDGDVGITVAPYITAGKTYTLVYSLNISRDADVTSPGIYAGTGSYQRIAASTTAIRPFVGGQPQMRWITFTGDTTAINNTLRVVQSMRNKTNGDWMEISDILLVEGSEVPKYASGATPNWIWNGTPWFSTSTGTPAPF